MKQRQKELPWTTLAARRMELLLAVGPKLGPEFLLLKAILEELSADQLTRGQIPLSRLLLRAGCSEASYHRHKRELLRQRLITAERVKGTNHGAGLVYWIDMPEVERRAFAEGVAEAEPVSSSLKMREQNSQNERAELSICESRTLKMREQNSQNERAEPEIAKSTPLTGSKDPSSTPTSLKHSSGSEEREWGELKNLLNKKLGLGDPHRPIDQARANRCTPADVRPVIAHALAHPGRWSPGEIWIRVKNTFPSRDPEREATEGWPGARVVAAQPEPAIEITPAMREAEARLAALPYAERASLARKFLEVGQPAYLDWQKRGRDSPHRWDIARGMLECETAETAT